MKAAIRSIHLLQYRLKLGRVKAVMSIGIAFRLSANTI